jgi:hypothetical protein
MIWFHPANPDHPDVHLFISLHRGMVQEAGNDRLVLRAGGAAM